MCMNMDIIYCTWWVEKKLRMAAAHGWGWIMFLRSETEWLGAASMKWGRGDCVLAATVISENLSNVGGSQVPRKRQVWNLEERKPAQVSRKPSVRAGSLYCGVCMLSLEIWLLVNYLYFLFYLPLFSAGKLSEMPTISVLSSMNMYCLLNLLKDVY